MSVGRFRLSSSGVSVQYDGGVGGAPHRRSSCIGCRRRRRRPRCCVYVFFAFVVAATGGGCRGGIAINTYI